MRKAGYAVRWFGSLLVALVMLGVAAMPSRAQGAAQLTVVKPAMECSALASVSLWQAVGVDVQLQVSTVTTAQGPFCHVSGVIAPSIHLEVDLPVERWTQRLLQAGCGGLCGNINASIGNAYGCQPALNGEFVVAASDLGHQTERMGAAGEGDFAQDPQKRIDFAYRANHLTALTAKALIKTYYGQPQRFVYFSGCSDGGREAMMEAERYPDDFDGISAGAPAMYFQVQNSINHAWMQYVNMRPDGSRILQGAMLEGGKLAPVRGMAAGPDGRGGGQQTVPYAQPAKAVLASRPIYPFPQIAHATGTSTSSVADFAAAPSDVKGPATQTWVGSELLAPVEPPAYTVLDGKLVRQ